MDSSTFRQRYLEIVREATSGFFATARMEQTIASIEAASAKAREREMKSAEERQRKMMAGFGGGGGFAPPQPMNAKTFVAKRNDSVAKQLSGTERGFTPNVPNFGGFGEESGGGQRQGAEAPISDAEFRESVQVPEGFNAVLFARSPEVNYPVAISAEPAGAIYVPSDEQGSLGTDKDGGKVLHCVDEDGDGVDDLTESSVVEDDQLVAAERASLLRATLESLPENWQYVLRQKYQFRLSVREIADLVDSTPKAIESTLSRARQRLRDLMRETNSEQP